ncbi:D-alanyl-D-alanine carboxypeptidase [Prochlorococcus sp. MIT 1307]|uniref:D-alanyl-D-alanine carboxypeptidase n=1 Tax=Prochlorococcus sp. MIT 1307 TaxID=3096219 RepID=UPI002A74F36B|nr:D-alanyl-D-alanine carboxypeptidase [Prochlorococcus sp. MIT 1307]
MQKLKQIVHNIKRKRLIAFISCFTLSLIVGQFYKETSFISQLKLSELKPLLLKKKDCPVLQKKILSLLGDDAVNWSITVLDEDRNIIASNNSYLPFIPASNIKLITTAFALDRLGPDFRLRTKLIRRSDGGIEFWGQGDPDLNNEDIKLFSKDAAPYLFDLIKKNKPPKIIIYEESSTNWWPDSWYEFDRLQSYGSPITRLAITSNSLNRSVLNPIDRFHSSLKDELLNYGLTPLIINKEHKKEPLILSGRKVIREIKSAPMISLLSLANSESHNFTAEILNRHAAGSWNSLEASRKAHQWLLSSGIPIDNFILVDGSGLSRTNRVTSIGIAALLWFMDHHKLSSFYKSSLAISGIRGTLSNLNYSSSSYGSFYGKTGTLSGVRAISGILITKDNTRYLSIINNNGFNQDPTISNILGLISRFSKCQ